MIILAGSALLCLPISSASGTSPAYIDALFTATTATCVTGLVTVTTASIWSVFGQFVILCLMQIGGLGVITILTMFMMFFGKKMGLSDRLLIMDSFSLNSLAGVVNFIKKVIIGSWLIETVGAMFYMIVFVPQFGAKGIWISIFNSVSAFCNAGMDIVPNDGISSYVTHPIINIVTCTLIVIGGIGFVVWWDVIKVLKDKKIRAIKNLSLHSKVVLSTTACLILIGAILIFIFEYKNPETIGNLSVFEKIQACFFQSITTRTAGFALLTQKSLTLSSVLVCIFLMFIGGSPISTAGGIKTSTLLIIGATALSAIGEKKTVNCFQRRLPEKAVKRAVLILFASFTLLFVSMILLSYVTDESLVDIFYETVSATATVGLSRGITPHLGVCGKIIIIITMFLGRVGPLSLILAFKGKEKGTGLTNPEEEVYVG